MGFLGSKMNQKIVCTLVAFISIQSFSSTSSVFAQTDDQNGSNDEVNVSMDLTSLLPVVRMIKGQIKEIVIDLAMQVFRFIMSLAQDMKVRLLKRLGKYTLSDAFHLIFDGVVEFVNDETSEASDSEVTTESATKVTTKYSNLVGESNEDEYEMESRKRSYNVNPYMWHQN